MPTPLQTNSRCRRRGRCVPCPAVPRPRRSSTTRWQSAHVPPHARSPRLSEGGMAIWPPSRHPSRHHLTAISQPSLHYLPAITLPSLHHLPTISQATEATLARRTWLTPTEAAKKEKEKAAVRPRTAAGEARPPAPLDTKEQEGQASWGATSATSQPDCTSAGTSAGTSAVVWRPLSLKLRGSIWMGRSLGVQSGAQSQPTLGTSPEPPRGLSRQATAPNAVGGVGARPRPAQCDLPQSAPFAARCRSADSRRCASPWPEIISPGPEIPSTHSAASLPPPPFSSL